MEHVRFGRTGLLVSKVALGTATFGTQCDEETSVAILDRAAEAGASLLDTADVYPMGGSLERRELAAAADHVPAGRGPAAAGGLDRQPRQPGGGAGSTQELIT